MLSLHYNGSNGFLFVNIVKRYQFKAKYTEIKSYPLYLGNVLKEFIIDSMKKTGSIGYVHASSGD